jgi:hypothetical protein
MPGILPSPDKAPQPVPVPADPPNPFEGETTYWRKRRLNHWAFLKWQVEKERADWASPAVAPHDVSPLAWLRGKPLAS